MADDTDTATPLPPVTVTAARPGMPGVGDTQAALSYLQKQDLGQYAKDDASLQKLDDAYKPQIAAAGKGVEDATKGLRDAMAKTPPIEGDPAAPDLKAKKMGAITLLGAITAGLLAGRAAHVSPLLTAADTITKTYGAFNANEKTRLDGELKNYQTQLAKVDRYNQNIRQQYEDAVALGKTNVTLANQQLDRLQKAYFDGASDIYNKEKSFQSRATALGNLVKQSEGFQDHMQKTGIELQRLANDRERTQIEQKKLDLATQKEHEKGGAMATQQVKDIFNLDENPGLNAKDASHLADAADGVRAMDMISRSLKNDPDLNRKVSLLLAQASGNADNWLSLTQNSQDAKVQAFSKELIELRRQGALLLAGDRGITVGGERIANNLLAQGATSPGGVAAIADTLGRDIKRRYVKFPNGQPIPWDKVTPLPEFGADTTPLVGPTGGSATPTSAASAPTSGWSAQVVK